MSQAQDLALAALAKRKADLDDAAIDRAREEKGSLATALVKTGALTQKKIADLLGDLVRTRFRCEGCAVELKYEALGRFEKLACDRCQGPLAPVVERPRERPAPKAPAPKSLERLGAYAVGDVLGRGSMGIVYRAKKDGDDREYALKVMKDGKSDPVLLARFEREAELAQRIEHPNVVKVFARGEEDGSFYYVMELCNGPTLQKRIQQGPIPPEEAARLVRDLASAAAAAHKAGAIHRDLKPANVILEEPGGRPRVTDFGLARDALSEQHLTRSGDTIGTPYYMAPEQVRAERDVDGRCDIYALGVILFECLAGRRPFEAKSAPELGKLILAGKRSSLKELAPSVPPPLEAIAMKSFSVSRQARYATAEELAQDLDRYLKGERPHALPGAVPPRKPRTVQIAAWVVAALVFAVGSGVHFARRWTDARRAEAEALVEAERQRTAALDSKKQADERARRDVEEQLALAEKAARDKRKDAFEVWRRARTVGGGAPLVELRYGQFLLRRSRVKEAVPVLRALVGAAALPGAAGLDARSRLAEALLRSRPPATAAAREELSKLVIDDADGARGRLAHARLALLDGRLDEARGAAEDSLKAEELAPAHVLLARLLAVGWEPSRAAARYAREAVDRAERSRGDQQAGEALRHADRAVALAPDDVDALNARSEVRLYLHLNRFTARERGPAEAEMLTFTETWRQDLHDAIEVAGSEPDARSLVLRGRFRLGEKVLPENGARADLDAALALDGADVEALVYRSVAEDLQKGDPLPWLRRALEHDERAAFAIARHFQIFKRPTVSFAFRAASERRKERGDAYARAHGARVDARLGRASPRARDALRDGVTRARKGEPVEDLVAAFERGAEVAPNDPVPLLELARALSGRGRLDEALAALERARALGADPVDLAALRGDTLLRAGRLGEAKDELAELERRTAGARKLLAQSALARANGDVGAARDLGVKAVQAAPDDPDARRALAAALLEGDAPEPDAASAEALWALELEGKADVESLHLLIQGGALGNLTLPHPLEDAVKSSRIILEKGARDLDAVAPVARFHVRTGLAILRAPSEAARALGRAEIEAARKLDPAGVEKLRLLLPELERALAR